MPKMLADGGKSISHPPKFFLLLIFFFCKLYPYSVCCLCMVIQEVLFISLKRTFSNSAKVSVLLAQLKIHLSN